MTLSPRFTDALASAARLHGDQLRKGTDIPYVAHLLGVAGIALHHGANEAQRASSAPPNWPETRGLPLRTAGPFCASSLEAPEYVAGGDEEAPGLAADTRSSGTAELVRNGLLKRKWLILVLVE